VGEREVARNKSNLVANANNEYESFEYDLNGNMTYDGKYSYEYDWKDRLVRVYEGSFQKASYLYDVFDRRVSKRFYFADPDEDPVDYNYVYDGNNLVQEYRVDSVYSTCQEYVYGEGLDDLVMVKVNGQAYYYLKDRQNSVKQLVDASGQVFESYEYDPYGQTKVVKEQDKVFENPYQYTGRRFDAETGLYYYRLRMYHPELGRFLQLDPAG
ncbi:MAG: hypothetical protein OMM_15137, partial [Candidatus Magnetoglobus multicellularis str. Araruama]